MFKTTLALLLLFCSAIIPASATNDNHKGLIAELVKIEKEFDGRIGVYAIDTTNNETIGHRADERFPFQSTLKLIAASALLSSTINDAALLNEVIKYKDDDLMYWSPITRKNLSKGMSLEALASATVSYSDNAALNLIVKQLGGPSAVTSYTNKIGNKSFKLSHYEGKLSSNPKTMDDTATPKDMAMSVQKLTLGDALPKTLQAKLIDWMKANTVAYKRIRAGVPLGWTVADKSGSGDYGIANDIGIVWSPACKPIVLSIYTARNSKDAARREDIVALTAKLVLNEFAKTNSCFDATKI